MGLKKGSYTMRVVTFAVCLALGVNNQPYHPHPNIDKEKKRKGEATLHLSFRSGWRKDIKTSWVTNLVTLQFQCFLFVIKIWLDRHCKKSMTKSNPASEISGHWYTGMCCRDMWEFVMGLVREIWREERESENLS